MATPKPITQISMHEITGRLMSRWKSLLGDDTVALKDALDTFLHEVPEYRAMPAWLLLGMGDRLPDGFQPTLPFLYKFYSNTEASSENLMLADAGEFVCKQAEFVSDESISFSNGDKEVILDRIREVKSTLSSKIDGLDDLNRRVDERKATISRYSMEIITRNHELSLLPDDMKVDVTDKINDAIKIMPKFGFQYVGINDNDGHKQIHFIVHPRKMHSARTENIKRGTLHAPFMMKMIIFGTGEIALRPTWKAARCRQCHPHISSAICWGSGRVTEAEMKGQVVKLLSKFDNMIRKYNASSPFINLTDYKRYASTSSMFDEGAVSAIDMYNNAMELSNNTLSLPEIFGTAIADFILADERLTKIYTTQEGETDGNHNTLHPSQDIL